MPPALSLLPILIIYYNPLKQLSLLSTGGCGCGDVSNTGGEGAVTFQTSHTRADGESVVCFPPARVWGDVCR